MEHDLILTQIAVVLAAAFIGEILLERFKQPVHVGYIFAGVLIGPSGFSLIEDAAQIQHLAELGILLLLFIVGLEIDISRFAPVYRVALITTGAQIFLGLGFMGVIGSMMDWSLDRVILLGFAISLSSTAVALKLLEDIKERDSQVGRLAIGILIAQDISVIPMLLIVGNLGSENPFNVFMLGKLMLGLGVMALLLWLFMYKPFAAGMANGKFRFFREYTGKHPVIVALAVCFSAAALSGAAGMSAAYGAFIAGLAVGNSSRREEYETSVRPVFDVLIMVFFMSVGILIDIDFLFENIVHVVAILFAVMLMKTIFNIGILRMLGLSQRHAFIAGAALGQVGEFSFVLAALGLAAGTILPDGYKFAVLIIALSLLVTPVWLYGLRHMRLVTKVWNRQKS